MNPTNGTILRVIFLACATLLVAGLASCSSKPENAPSLMVFAASSLQDITPNLASRFTAAHPDCPVKHQFAGSQQLATQLHHGAKADVFLSADKQQAQRIVDADLASGPAVPFAANRLVLIVSRQAFDNGLTSLPALAKPGWKLVLTAPEVPAGFYTRKLLERLSADPAFGAEAVKQLRANAVSQENNVRATAAKVTLGEADAAIGYATDAATLNRQQVETIPIPASDRATYYAVVLKSTTQPEDAQQWLDFLKEEKTQRMLKQFGFLLP